MTDEEYVAQKARVEALIEKWATPLGIKWWDVDYVWHRLRHEGTPACAAEMHTTWQYLKAVGEWYLPELAALDDAALEKVVIHEHVHILLAEMASDKQEHDAEERVCSLLTKAIIWTYEAGQRNPVAGEERAA